MDDANALRLLLLQHRARLWGAPDVLDRVPAECFIDMRMFKGFGKLRTFLHALTAAKNSATAMLSGITSRLNGSRQLASARCGYRHAHHRRRRRCCNRDELN